MILRWYNCFVANLKLRYVNVILVGFMHSLYYGHKSSSYMFVETSFHDVCCTVLANWMLYCLYGTNDRCKFDLNEHIDGQSEINTICVKD